MKNRWVMVLGLSLAFVSIGAQAEIVQVKSRGEAMSFEELRMRCMHPRDFDRSVAPENILIACQSTELKWLDLGHFYGDVRASQVIEAEVSFSYGHTAIVPLQFPAVPPFMCSKYKPVREVKTYVQQVSCEDLIKIEDSIDLVRYCMDQLKAGKASDPGFYITQAPVGSQLNSCSMATGVVAP